MAAGRVQRLRFAAEARKELYVQAASRCAGSLEGTVASENR
jgi:hypothetical protein